MGARYAGSEDRIVYDGRSGSQADDLNLICRFGGSFGCPLLDLQLSADAKPGLEAYLAEGRTPVEQRVAGLRGPLDVGMWYKSTDGSRLANGRTFSELSFSIFPSYAPIFHARPRPASRCVSSTWASSQFLGGLGEALERLSSSRGAPSPRPSLIHRGPRLFIVSVASTEVSLWLAGR